jgi:hypothetical protein
VQYRFAKVGAQLADFAKFGGQFARPSAVHVGINDAALFFRSHSSALQKPFTSMALAIMVVPFDAKESETQAAGFGCHAF